MPIAKNNFSRNENYEVGSVDITYLTVDFINAMNAETSDLSGTGSTRGLELTRATIENNGVAVLGEGPLADSNTQKTYAVRTDNLDTLSSTTTKAALQTAIRALNGGDGVSATVSSATVTETKLGILTAAAIA
mgnify:CR=1 FL=1|jgi:hypothetical protein